MIPYLNIWTLFSQPFFFSSFLQKIAEKSKTLLPTGQRSTKQVISCISMFNGKYIAKKRLFSNPTNDAEECGAPPLPTWKTLRCFSNRNVWHLWRRKIQDPIKKKAYVNLFNYFLLFCSIRCFFFHSGWEFCHLWNVSKRSPVSPSFRLSEITLQVQIHRSKRDF